MSAESASSRNAASTTSALPPNQVGFAPSGIHVHSVATTPSWPCVSPHHAKIAANAATHERIEAAGPMTACAAANGISCPRGLAPCVPVAGSSSPVPAGFLGMRLCRRRRCSSPCPCGPFGASLPPSFEWDAR